MVMGFQEPLILGAIVSWNHGFGNFILFGISFFLIPNAGSVYIFYFRVGEGVDNMGNY